MTKTEELRQQLLYRLATALRPAAVSPEPMVALILDDLARMGGGFKVEKEWPPLPQTELAHYVAATYRSGAVREGFGAFEPIEVKDEALLF